ncbi:hypothetical protein [Nocardioides sp.]|uniref:HNH endonuclease signature motif containing protein n=1 Tax=Nocardioides sp. TaxID=35761 RepID=UPI003513B597
MTLGDGFDDVNGGVDDGPVAPFDGVSSSVLLDVLVGEEQARQASEIRTWQGVVAWAERNLHDGESEREVEDVVAALDTGVRLAGEGTPLVAEFALMELVAVLGRTPDGGRRYVARILECAWRLPHVYAAVISGRLAPWRAAKIAEATVELNAQAAAFVDHQLFAAHRVSWAQLDRLIDEAIKRFDADLAEAQRQRECEQLGVRFSDPTTDGIAYLDATLDAGDAADLEAATRRRAATRAQFGDESSHDVRMARSLGDMARNDLELDLTTVDESTGELITASVGRKAEVVVHLTPESLTGENPVGRCNNRPVATTQTREWLQQSSHITIRPVVDLAGCDHVDAYEIPDRLRRHTTWRDHTCRFPGCTHPATSCDLDHRTPYDQGGATCPCNLTPLCRRHHRAKTHSRWRYTALAPGIYRWTSPLGHRFLVTPTGTYPQRE